MYAVALIGSGRSADGLSQARHMFERIRAAAVDVPRAEVSEQIDEGIEFVGRFITGKGILPSSQATMELMWTMIENGGLVTPVVDQLLAGVGPESIAQLNADDLTLMLQVQAGILAGGAPVADIAGPVRFAEFLQSVIARGMHVDLRTQQLVERALHALSPART